LRPDRDPDFHRDDNAVDRVESMYLKRLEIDGFKSFARQTTLEFIPPKDGRFSITAVVGPNGSGKSNVVDAIRWVMGETSLKQLRGKKSEDVIFNGSVDKGALSACSVTMVLDNTGSGFGIDYPEIVITRRLYRSGEGEYLINNSPVRLLDIHLLLARAQFGQHSYSIISQGTIDRLLVVTPSERKDFLDEASGIKEFQIKEHQASLKLARTRENSEQATRLLAEIEPRLKLLSRQVKKLEKRQEVELALRECQEKYYGSLYLNNKKETDRLDTELEMIEKNYRSAFEKLTGIQNELSELARQATRTEVFGQLQERHSEATRIKNDLERQLAVLSGKLENVYNEAGKQNLGWLTKKISDLKNENSALSAKCEQADVAAARLVKLMADRQMEADKLSAERTELSVRVSQAQHQNFGAQSERQFFEYSGLAAVKAVLDNRGRFGKVYGMLADLGEVEEQYRVGLEVAAGAHLSSLVVGDDEVAKKAIEWLRADRLGYATFLPMSKITGRLLGVDADAVLNEKGVIGWAIDLVKFDKQFYDIFSFVLGDNLLVENLATAQRIGIGRYRMVTLDGDVIEKKGVMRGGYRGNKKRGPGFSGKWANMEVGSTDWQAEVNRLQEDLRLVERALENKQAEILGLRSESETHKAQAAVLGTQARQKEMELTDLEKEQNYLAMSPEEHKKYLGNLGQEKEDLEEKISRAQKVVVAADLEIKDFNNKEEAKKQRVFALQIEMQTAQNSVNEIISGRNDLKIQLAKLETRQEDLAAECSAEISASPVNLVERLTEGLDAAGLADAADQIQKLKYQLSLIGGIEEGVVEEYTTTKEKFDFLSGQLTDLEKATNDLETMIDELTEIMKKKREASFKKIRKEFDRYFKILFNGGSAALEEIYGEVVDEDEVALAEGGVMSPPARGGEAEGVGADDLADESKRKKITTLTGIDITACPPGKKIKNLSALSGGERTLTSIALVCAILSCNPAPFVVMDEVEAALDEANTLRFANIMSELSRQSQFIVITHNRVTMHSADVLYGVTMGGEGVSKLLSVKLEDVNLKK